MVHVFPFLYLQEFNTAKEARASPLASKLFDIPEIKSVLLGNDYVCVTRQVSAVPAVDSRKV